MENLGHFSFSFHFGRLKDAIYLNDVTSCNACHDMLVMYIIMLFWSAFAV